MGVDRFYSFWFEFSSWREYSYLDEEDKEKAGDKWERREIDKINKAQRKEKKAEETKRIRKLVDNAYNSDPRIARFRKEEMEEKAAKKKAKADQAKARRDEEERLKREAEAEEKQKANAVKQEKEAQKKALKAERKKLRNLSKEVNKLAYENLQKGQKKEVLERCAEESKGTERTDNVAELAGLNATAWTPDEQKLLEQALKTYDSKTPERWDRISEAVPGRSKKDCMKRYKELAEIVKAKKAAALAASKKS